MHAERRALGALGSGVRVGGVGAARATRAAEQLVAAGADLLVSFGVAGGLHEQAVTGTLLLPHTVRWQGHCHACAGALRDALGARLRGRVASLGGTLLGVEDMVLTRAARQALSTDSRVMGVDMESGAVAAVADRHGVPLLVVRAVCDGPAAAVSPALARLLSADGRARLPAAVALLLRRPGALAELARLGLGLRHALGTLNLASAALTEVLGAARVDDPHQE